MLKVLIKVFLAGLILSFLSCNENKEETFVEFSVSPNKANIGLYWKDDDGKYFKSIKKLRDFFEKKGNKLRFAMNGGMYQEDNKPLGLFIQKQKEITPLNTKEGLHGNFYLQPNGVFFMTADKKAFVSTTQNFKNDGQVEFATQSGPMLVVNGAINSEFKQDSGNVNLRNGVCVLDDNRIIFSISRKEVNLYSFAQHFKDLGCQNALYLDGFVSRMYLPEKNIEELDGDFGVIIGITE